MTTEPEVLGAEVLEPAPPWRPSRRLAVLLVLVVVAGGVAWYADHRSRASEAAAVSACEQRLRNASAHADRYWVVLQTVGVSLIQTAEFATIIADSAV